MSKNIYTYDVNNDLIEDLFQYWHNSEWLDGRRHTYIYDGKNNMIEDLYQNWKESNWVDGYKETYTYDENNNLIKEFSQFWFSSGWRDDDRTTYIYIPVTGVELDNNEIITYKLSNNYPNPFNPTTMISYSIPTLGNVELKVFDVLGREVATLLNKDQQAGNYNVQFDAGHNLTSGIYFYILSAGTFSQSRKMILIK